MNLKIKLFSLPLILAFIIFSGLIAQAQNKPNIVIIYVDDLGYGDVGSYGAIDVETPNIDRLADKGIKFTDAHASAAMCTPSRFSLLTGSYAFRENATILPGDAPMLIKEDTPTLPGMLQKQGYTTGVIGKWHLGMGDGNVNWNEKIAPGPLEIGFDYSYLIPATGDRVPCVLVENHHVVGLDPSDPIEVSYDKKVGTDPTGLENPELLRYGADDQHAKTIVNGVSRIGYMSGGNSARWNDETVPHQMLHKARDFMSENMKNPFFLYFSFHDIHVPYMPDYQFRGASDMGLRGDAIVQMDWITGQLMDYLGELGIAENTIIVFSSDNGPVLTDGYDDGALEDLGKHKPAGPFRGGKYSAYEAGTRVPTIVCWPSVIEPGLSDALWGQLDLYASFANMLNYELKDGEAPDSENVLEAMMGKSDTGREYLLKEAYTFSLRKGDYKYIHPVDEVGHQWIKNDKGIESGLQTVPQLFDLSKDISETTNIADKERKVLKEMQKELERIINGDQSRK